MKKILAAIDGLKYSQTTTDYAVQLASEMKAELVGVFLDDYTYHSYKIYDLVGEEGAVSEKQKYVYDEQDKESRQRSTAFFKASCLKAGLTYSIHHDRNFAIRELLHESMFADLLIIDSRETLTHYEENLPTEFVQSLLAQVECPVVLVPGKYEPFEKVSLLYDGKPSSLYAIKMCSYLFPSLKQKEVEIIRVNRSSKTKQNPDNRLVKEFLKRHFPDASYTILQGLPEPEIVNYLRQQDQEQLIVLGAYRRSRVSRWLKPSLADGLMKQLGYPLFIAHH